MRYWEVEGSMGLGLSSPMYPRFIICTSETTILPTYSLHNRGLFHST